MRAIEIGAPMRRQLKANLKLLFEDFVSPDQRRQLRDLRNPAPVNPSPRRPAQRPRRPRRPIIKTRGVRINKALEAIRRGPRQ